RSTSGSTWSPTTPSRRSGSSRRTSGRTTAAPAPTGCRICGARRTGRSASCARTAAARTTSLARKGWRNVGSPLVGGGVEAHAADVLVEPERLAQRGKGALVAVGALAQPAGHADRHDAVAEVLQVDAVRVH